MSIAVDSNAPLREVELPAADAPLRADVNRLGILVGEILSEQRGPAFLAAVERVRVAAIRRRESGGAIGELAAALRDAVGTVPAPSAMPDEPAIEQAEALGPRFRHLFPRGEHRRAGAPHPPPPRLPAAGSGKPQPGGLEDVFAAPGGQGVGPRSCCSWLPRIAHRAGVHRPSHRSGAPRAAREGTDHGRRAWWTTSTARTPGERRSRPGERFRMAADLGWQTADSSPERPRSGRARARGRSISTEVLYRVMPVFYEDPERCLRPRSSAIATELPRLLRFGDLGRGRHGWQSECRCRHHRGRACDPAQPDHRALPQGHRAPRQRAQPVHLARGCRCGGARPHR
jgi:phosphoenolpyruvate carboxylase